MLSYIELKQTHSSACLRRGWAGLCRACSNPFVELLLVTIAAVCMIRVLNSVLSGYAGLLVIPVILTGAALVPTLIRGDKITAVGLHPRRLRYSLLLLSLTCLTVFPVVWGGLWLLAVIGTKPPILPFVVGGQWLSWVLYQFFYVAFAEEIFFRGYIVSRLLQWRPPLARQRPRVWHAIIIIISAAVFALAHIILLQNILSVLTFFPGLILGWLFIRTQSLVAPILFHALANIFYALVAAGIFVSFR
ncbi:MAG: CPBP family intramembrane metalloprotease [Sedimentisphaerales bacterium]|nr:CPBP family intramembrane metalloprotease [Sedimentisphaerales bacterium]